MTDRKKGIVDPWRTVEPVRPVIRPTRPERKRINIDEIDHDADLVVPGRHVLRSTHACFDITSTRIQTEGDALDVLATCVATLFRIPAMAAMLKDGGVGVRCPDYMWNVPSEDIPASTLRSESSALWFAHKPLDQGMLTLAKTLRSHLAVETLRRYGIVVMMTAS